METLFLLLDVLEFFELATHRISNAQARANNQKQRPPKISHASKRNNSYDSSSSSEAITPTSSSEMTTPSSLPSLVTDDGWDMSSSPSDGEVPWRPQLSELSQALGE